MRRVEEIEQAQIRKKEFVSLKFIRQSFAFYSSFGKNKKKNFSIDMKLKWKQRTNERKKKVFFRVFRFCRPFLGWMSVIEGKIEGRFVKS